jgi:hypothetical protein
VEDGPASSCEPRSFGASGREPPACGCGEADRAAAPATGGLPVEGSGQAAAPGEGRVPLLLPGS